MQLHITEITPIRHRRHDPATSRKAAHNADKFANSHKSRILAALRLHGPRAACELEQIVGLTIVQLDRRLPELEREGLIEVLRSADGDVTIGGCRVWGLTE